MKDIVDAFLAEIDATLRPYGFAYIRSRRSFERRFAGGKQSLHLSINRYADTFDVAADIGIRLDALEDLLHAHDSSLSTREKAVTYSIGCELGNLAYDQYHRWTVHGADGIALVAAGVTGLFIGHGLPYFDRYSSLQSAFALIAPHPQRACLHRPFVAHRAKCVLGLAILLGEQKALPGLLLEYEAALMLHRASEREEFRTFALLHLDAEFMQRHMGHWLPR